MQLVHRDTWVSSTNGIEPPWRPHIEDKNICWSVQNPCLVHFRPASLTFCLYCCSSPIVESSIALEHHPPSTTTTNKRGQQQRHLNSSPSLSTPTCGHILQNRLQTFADTWNTETQLITNYGIFASYSPSYADFFLRRKLP